MNLLYQFLASEEGPTAVEYAVMLALIIAACLTAVATVGESTSSSFGNARDKINSAVSGS